MRGCRERRWIPLAGRRSEAGRKGTELGPNLETSRSRERAAQALGAPGWRA